MIAMSLQRATVHDWANVFAWLADPSDARWARALRAACRLGVDGFDTAVHAGWITLAAHDRSAREEEGATCMWVRGWIPVDFKGCGGADRSERRRVRCAPGTPAGTRSRSDAAVAVPDGRRV
jgi:hypothetical protein